jgi:ATP-dependent helicase/nuclease subunit A
MVTFTEAAAAEMRARIREELQRRLAGDPADEHLSQQLALLDTARISTLHSFCLQLAREHFHELGLDPQFSVLDEAQTRPLARQALDELMEEHYSREDDPARAFQALVRTVGRGADDGIRKLVLKLHRHSQSLDDPAGWLNQQQERFEKTEPHEWRQWFLEGVAGWRGEFLDSVAERSAQAPAVRLCHEALRQCPPSPQLSEAIAVLRAVQDADRSENWPRGTKGRVRDPLEEFFEAAAFLASLLPDGQGHDPLAQDWDWTRPHLLALLSLTREFTARFTAAKREMAGVDFADLEQCALRLLREPAIVGEWRARLSLIFVDEYQDINAAQDAILTALSRGGEDANRFLVGDVKQSIYRFRLANPRIFGEYAERWSRPDAGGRRIPLTENFRSRQALLMFVNPFFAALMRPEVGGVTYEPLEFGAPDKRGELAVNPGDAPRVELHLIAKAGEETGAESPDDEAEGNGSATDLLATEREARLVARLLRELKLGGQPVWDRQQQAFRAVKWSDMAVLLRSPSGRAETFAMEFSRAGVPLVAGRDGFFESLEVGDLLNLLRLLDNPLQDVPLAAVLRSPLVGLSVDELAEIRASNSAKPFWNAMVRWREDVWPVACSVEGSAPQSKTLSLEGDGEDAASPAQAASSNLFRKVDLFLTQFSHWRELVRQKSLSECLETALQETHYEAMLLAGARGQERLGNVRRLLDLARQFDPYQRQGLYRFLRFVEAQEEEGLDLQPAPAPAGDAVQLMSVHKSKGLEFPVVVLACLGTRFNERDLNGSVLLSERHGLCPRVTPPEAPGSYASLPYWLARRRERLELRGEELRLLYVAMTRARDRLILTGTSNHKTSNARWPGHAPQPVSTAELAGARSQLEWLLQWLSRATAECDWQDDRQGRNGILSWRLYDENDAVFAGEAPAATLEGTMAGQGDKANSEVIEQLKERLAWTYPFMAATQFAAKTSVSAIRRRAVGDEEEEARRMFEARARRGKQRRQPAADTGKLSAVERGSAHHRFLQLMELAHTSRVEELKAQAETLVRTGRMKPEEAAALDWEAMLAFWQSDLGGRIQAETGGVRRELAFTARFTPAELAAVTGEGSTGSQEEFVVVQGVADLVVLRPDELWLLDFKTDEIKSEEVPARAKHYGPQLKLYALALERIYRRPVTECWLHFLAPRRMVRVGE